MRPEPRRVEPGPGPSDRTDRLRGVIAREFEALLRSIAPLVCSYHGLRSSGEVAERAAEVLNEAVRRALAHADRYEPNRSAFAWIRGIAVRVLKGQRRDAARERRQPVERRTVELDHLERLELAIGEVALRCRPRLVVRRSCCAPAAARRPECSSCARSR